MQRGLVATGTCTMQHGLLLVRQRQRRVMTEMMMVEKRSAVRVRVRRSFSCLPPDSRRSTSFAKNNKYTHHYSDAIQRHVSTDSSSSSSSSLTTKTKTRTVHLSTFSPDNNEKGDNVTRKIPITLADIFLRHEHLPFAYFFDQQLDARLLQESLERILQEQFGVAGGELSSCSTHIYCQTTDTIPMTVTKISGSQKDWHHVGHCHTGTTSSAHHDRPMLNQLFDELVLEKDSKKKKKNLMSVKVTYFDDGCCLGVNMSHLLADTAACIHLVESWGDEMTRVLLLLEQQEGEKTTTASPESKSTTGRQPKRMVSWKRSKASVTGMMTEDRADLLGLLLADSGATKKHGGLMGSTGIWISWIKDAILGITSPRTANHETTLPQSKVEEEEEEGVPPHAYISMQFSPLVLQAMKAHHDAAKADSFVSTNDLVTAAGWLWKRQLSGLSHHRLSMVVNLRGRNGVGSFKNLIQNRGLFGNAITNFIVDLPVVTKDLSLQQDGPPLAAVSAAAVEVRKALVDCLAGLPDRLAHARVHNESNGFANGQDSFATTSWSQLSPWKIRFGTVGVDAFHGQPTHAVAGETYSSVIHQTSDGGRRYDLLLPQRKIREAQQLHNVLCQQYLDWAEDARQTQQMLKEEAP